MGSTSNLNKHQERHRVTVEKTRRGAKDKPKGTRNNMYDESYLGLHAMLVYFVGKGKVAANMVNSEFIAAMLREARPG